MGDSRAGITIMPLREADMQYFPAEEKKDVPVLFERPNPSSIMLSYFLYLPDAAHLSIDIYDEKGKKESRFLDKWWEKGAYELRIGPGFFNAGRHTMGVLVNKKLLETQKMTIMK
jgi:hypothetical protein